MKKYKFLIRLIIIAAVLFSSGSFVLAASLTEHFNNTVYKDAEQTTADWNTGLGRLQLPRDSASNRSYANVAYDGTYTYIGYMASDCVRVAKLDSSGRYVSSFGEDGLSDCVSSYWAGPSTFDITVTQGGIYVLYRNNLLQRLNATTGAREWVVDWPQDPEGFYTLLYDKFGSKKGWTMTSDKQGYVYIGGGDQTAGYYIIKMENGGQRKKSARRKVLDSYPATGNVDIAIGGAHLYLAWEEGNSCFVQKYSKNTLLEIWQEALEINSCSGYLGITVEAEGSFYLLSQKGNNFEIRKYDSSKNLLWGPVVFNREGDWPSVYYNAGYVYAAWRDKDWSSYHSIRLQRFNTATGEKIFDNDGLEIKNLAWAFHETDLPRHRPGLVVDNSGNALIAFTDELSAPYNVEVSKVLPGADLKWQVPVPEGDAPFQLFGTGQSVGYDIGADEVEYNSFSGSETLNDGSITYQFSDSSDGVNWSTWVSDIGELSQRYIRWKAYLSSSDNNKSPWLDWISINYTADVTPSNCIIEGVSYPDGTYNPDNGCQFCDISQNTANWSDVTDGSDPNGWCSLTWESCDSICVRGGGDGKCYSGSCDTVHRTGNIASGYVCTGSGEQTPVSSLNYCNYDENCDEGDCAAVEWWTSCDGRGSCRPASDHSNAHSENVYPQEGHTLTATCGIAGTEACGYSDWKKCSSNKCQKAREMLACDSNHTCTFYLEDDWVDCSPATACMNGNCSLGNLCDDAWRASDGEGDNNYDTGGDFLCQGSCDGSNNCDYAVNCCADNGQNCSSSNDCCSNNCLSSASIGPGSVCCPLDSSCVVEQECRSSVSESCTANDAKDYDISQSGDSIDDYWCIVNEHDGCQYVKSGVKLVNGQFNPGFWEGESCGGDGGSSNLYGQKIVVVDDISKYDIRAKVYVDDNSWVWINNQEVTSLHRACCGWTEWVDVTDYFQTGENHIRFRAEDTCSGDRYFNLDWDVKSETSQVSTKEASDIKWNQAQLNGELTDLGGANSVNVWFVWSNNYYDDPGDYENETAHKTQLSPGLFTDFLEGLMPVTAYHYRAMAENSGGIAYGEDKEFITEDAPAEKGSVHLRVHEVDEEGNHLGWLNDATVKLTNSSGETVYQTKTSSYNNACQGCGDWGDGWVWFDDVYPGPYGVLAYRPGFEGQWKQVDCAVNGSLFDATIQNVNTEGQVAAWDDETPINRNDITWCQDLGLKETSIITPPTVFTRNSDNIKPNQAQLNGELENLGGADTVDVWFEWGVLGVSGYGNKTSHQERNSVGFFSLSLDGLSSETTYKFRAVAENSAGIMYGETKTFTTLPREEGELDLSASATVAVKGVFKKYAFPIEAPSQFNFIGLSGHVAVSSAEAQTSYPALISIQNATSGNCPPPGSVWDTYDEMFSQYPAQSISNFIVKNVGPGRKEVPTNFTFPIKVPVQGCIYLVLDGSEPMEGKPITIESHMKLIYDTEPPPSPAPYFIHLDHEFCYGQEGCFLWTSDAKPENAFAKTIKIDTPLYLWSLSGNVSAQTFTHPWAGHPTGSWTSNFDYYLYKDCPPPLIGNSGPQDYYNQTPGDATHLLGFQLEGNGKGAFHKTTIETFEPKRIEAGSCLVALTKSQANGALSNESQVFALVQPAPSTCPDCLVEGECRDHVEKACTSDNAKDNDISQLGNSIDDYWCTYNEHDGCFYVKSGVNIVNGQVLKEDSLVSHPFWEGESCGGDGGSSNLYGEKKVYVDDIDKYIIRARVNVDDSSWIWINNQEIAGLHREYYGWTDWVDVTNYLQAGWNLIKFRAKDACSAERYFNLDWDVNLKQPSQQTIDLSASKTVATTTYKKYAFPIETPSKFNFIGLSGYVAVESSEAQTQYATLISIQNVPSGNCPSPGTVWDTYKQMGQQYPGVHSISAFIVRDIGSGREEVPTEFTFPIKVPITGCIFVVLDGADIKQGKTITMESKMKLIYDTEPAPSPAPYIVQLDHEFCYGLNYPPICTTEKPESDKAFARTIKIDSPVYLWSLTGDVSTSTFVPPWTGEPSGQWTTEFDYYLYKNCPPPPIGNSGPSDYYSQIPGDAESLLKFFFQGNGRGVFNQQVFKTFGPKLINPGDCFVSLTRSMASNAGLDNESQVYALVQPAPAGSGALKTDLDNDGQTTSDDFKILLKNWGADFSNPAADLNSDGVVDSEDLEIMQEVIEQ
jgi:hypothetical protein